MLGRRKPLTDSSRNHTGRVEGSRETNAKWGEQIHIFSQCVQRARRIKETKGDGHRRQLIWHLQRQEGSCWNIRERSRRKKGAQVRMGSLQSSNKDNMLRICFPGFCPGLIFIDSFDFWVCHGIISRTQVFSVVNWGVWVRIGCLPEQAWFMIEVGSRIMCASLPMHTRLTTEDLTYI